MSSSIRLRIEGFVAMGSISRLIFLKSSKGFSLVEMLVVLTIIGLIIGLIGPRILSYISSSRDRAAQIQIRNFQQALDLFYIDVGRYPTTSENLVALIKKPAALDGWRGPYLKSDQIPRDPWNVDYAYRFPGEHGDYDILSYGADGREGGNDENTDITSW